MPLYHVTFSKELDCIIEADSKEELDAACREHCLSSDIDEWNPGEWQHCSSGEMKGSWNGRSEPDMGVANGECLEINDYRKAEAERAELDANIDRLRLEGKDEEADQLQFGGKGDGHRCNICDKLAGGDRKHRCWAKPDPRQATLPFDCTGRGCGCTPGCSGRNDDP